MWFLNYIKRVKVNQVKETRSAILFNKVPCKNKMSDVRITRLDCAVATIHFLQTKYAKPNPNFIPLFRLIGNYSHPCQRDGEKEGKEAK